MDLLVLPRTSFVVNFRINLPTVSPTPFFFLSYKLIIFPFTLTFPSTSVLCKFPELPSIESQFLLQGLVSVIPQSCALPCAVSLRALFSDCVTNPVSTVCSRLAYSSMIKEGANFAGGFYKSSLFANVLLLTLKSVLL